MFSLQHPLCQGTEHACIIVAWVPTPCRLESLETRPCTTHKMLCYADVFWIFNQAAAVCADNIVFVRASISLRELSFVLH